MRIDVLTLFPGMFAPVLCESVIGRAVKNGVFELHFTDIRDFTIDKHKKTDDYPYGGGHGMIMTAQPLYDAWRSLMPTPNDGGVFSGDGGAGEIKLSGSGAALNTAMPPARTIYMSPQGTRLTQNKAKELSLEERLIIICGHYEGVDERVLELTGAEEISIGDYVLTGGEIPAMALIDCVARLIPGVISDEAYCCGESHLEGLLEFPQYTRPASFMGLDVPPVLLNGNHADIKRWRAGESLERTRRKRPDMLEAPVRRLPLGYAVNMRDLGGYPVGGGFVTRWRTFLRSDSLEGFSGQNKYALLEFGLTTVIDLRSKSESESMPDPVTAADGVDIYSIPLIPDSVITKSIKNAPFKELYALFTDRGIKKVGKAFKIMAGCGGVCLFHCYAGKDRTGVLAALLLLAVGVDKKDVVADYEVSGTYYNRKITAYGDNDYDKSKAENIEYLMDHLEKKYGGATAYLKEAGVTDGDLRALRDKFLTKPTGL